MRMRIPRFRLSIEWRKKFHINYAATKGKRRKMGRGFTRDTTHDYVRND
jgi:hypothetical protein